VIEGKALLCAPGGGKGRIVALDKTSGARIWVNTEIADRAAYCSPIVVTHDGVRQMITLMQKSVVSVDVKTGKLLWTHEHTTKHDQNVTAARYKDGYVYVSSGHGTGGKLLKIGAGSKSVRRIWTATDQDNCHGGVLLLDGYLYGSGCRLFRKGLVCVDFLTGKSMWNERKLGKLSMTYADGLLYCIDDKAKVSLVDASASSCRVDSSFQLPRKGRGLSLAHPTVCGGRLYIRHGNDLYAFNVSAAAGK
jgi:outer membrane protein assembly factor BamB